MENEEKSNFARLPRHKFFFSSIDDEEKCLGDVICILSSDTLGIIIVVCLLNVIDQIQECYKN
ncbi:hypothetical protein T4D_1041 [Trichinella pseudospiralis]|uniref:Uncharacterized protein n=1 Tax=Trichinella pseudospiralis TaxID=6337 RepID=A0A0V1FN05_TRIPS|nr:hypothetical protein T4D_1041 [Trichinella pseudospiralis]